MSQQSLTYEKSLLEDKLKNLDQKLQRLFMQEANIKAGLWQTQAVMEKVKDEIRDAQCQLRQL